MEHLMKMYILGQDQEIYQQKGKNYKANLDFLPCGRLMD